MANPSDRVFIPSPPRLTGDWPTDVVTVSTWMSQFYTANTTPPGVFDPGNLPDPTNTTTGLAQQTANEAYNLARKLNVHFGNPV